MQVHFYDTADDAALKYAVIVARSGGRWVFCRHKNRRTWEIPGGHREPGETIEAAARRELWEETGALEYSLAPVCVYSVCSDDGDESFGMLYRAEIARFDALPPLEIAEICLTETLPGDWTYPTIQPLLLAEAAKRCGA